MFHRPKAEDQSQPEEKKSQGDAAQKTDAQTTGTVESNDVPKSSEQTEKETSYDPTPVMKNDKTENMTETNKTEENTMSNDQKSSPSNTARPLDIPGSTSFQQRTAQPAPQTRTMTPSYLGGSSMASQHAPEDGSRLFISQGITMSGEIEACDYLVIEGTVEASLKGARVLEVAETGTFFGAVEIEEAIISGRFEGDITVNGRLTISSSGTVTGTISYKELEVEAGATIDGRMSPMSGGVATKKTTTKKETKKVAPRNDNAGEEGKAELPFEGSAVAAAE